MKLLNTRKKLLFLLALCLAVTALFAAGCGDPPGGESKTGKSGQRTVTVTTSFLADMTKELAGDYVRIEMIIPAGEDPHLYVAQPKDLQKLKEADLVLYHGLHFEGKMVEVLEKKGTAVSADFPPGDILRLEEDGAQSIAEYSNALFALNYVSEGERAPFAGLLAGFDGFFCREDRVPLMFHAHERLRIGYISPDLRHHAVAFFLLPLLRAFDRGRFDVFCYANNREDAVSRAMAQQDGVVWRNILGLSPDDAPRFLLPDRRRD